MAAIVHKCYFCKSSAITCNSFGTFVCHAHVKTQVCMSCELSMQYSVYSIIDTLAQCQRCKNAILGCSAKWLSPEKPEPVADAGVDNFDVVSPIKKCSDDGIFFDMD